jgi:5-methylcytosine-specific restriction endonuclease McrA
VNDLTKDQWLLIQEAQNHRCAYCGRRAKGHLTQDHILALANGGSHTLHNVIGACRPCNSKKHTGPPPVPVQPLLL